MLNITRALSGVASALVEGLGVELNEGVALGPPGDPDGLGELGVDRVAEGEGVGVAGRLRPGLALGHAAQGNDPQRLGGPVGRLQVRKPDDRLPHLLLIKQREVVDLGVVHLEHGAQVHSQDGVRDRP